jgi:hypothetical protein
MNEEEKARQQKQSAGQHVKPAGQQHLQQAQQARQHALEQKQQRAQQAPQHLAQHAQEQKQQQAQQARQHAQEQKQQRAQQHLARQSESAAEGVISAAPSLRADATANDRTSLLAAVTAAPNGTPYVIEMTSTFPINARLDVPGNKILTFTGATIYRDPGWGGYMFDIATTSTLTLTNITIDGNKGNITASTSMIYSSGTINITEGAVLQNNLNSGSTATPGGAIVNSGTVNMSAGVITGNSDLGTVNSATRIGGGIASINNGVLNLSGGEISGNSALYGGGVSFQQSSTFHMTGGVITNNVGYLGAAVILYGSNVMVMDGGEIVGNHSDDLVAGNGGGGGVVLYGTSQFTLNDGLIAENTAYRGGGVYTYAGTTFTMHDGVIENNHASTLYVPGSTTASAGGVFNQGTTVQSGGVITGNTAEVHGAGVYNNTGATYTMTGGEIVSNVAAADGGGIYNVGTFSGTTATIAYNIAVRGGGIYVDGTGVATLTDATLVLNMADYGGGAYVNTDAKLTLSGSEMLVSENEALSSEVCDTGGGIFSVTRTNAIVNPGVIFTRNDVAHAYAMQLSPADLSAYNSAVHDPSLDPIYDYAWNNADINWCPSTPPTMEITYWRNSELGGNPTQMSISFDLAEGEEIPPMPPPWDNGEMFFAGWSLNPDDTCPTLREPMPTTFQRADFDQATPPHLSVYAIWCDEPIYHEVTFDANGGSAVPSQSILDGEKATFGLSTRAGCFLEGWYTNARLDVRFNFNTPIYENLTLHAKWECPGDPGYERDKDKIAELAELEALLAALEAGEKCYNIGILTEYGYRLVEVGGTVYLHNQLTQQQYLTVVPITIQEVEEDIARLEEGGA